MRHHALLATTLILVGGSVAGCGGGDAPADASEKTYCDTYNSLFEDMSSMGEADDEDVIAAIKKWGRDMQEVGTPDNIPDEAREGFDTSMEMLAELDEKATPEDFDRLDDELSDAQQKAVDAFDTYTTDTCGSPLDNLDLPEMPEMPSDAPTE